MYTDINSNKDVMRERYIYGSELVGQYDFPMLPKTIGSPELIEEAYVFKEAHKCKHPRKSLCHFFTADEQFERVWDNPERYVSLLQDFKFVCGMDFTCYGNMPLALRVYQTYRSRALSWYLYNRGVNIIPCVGWNDADPYSWMYDGLPVNSIVAVSTNGCHGAESEEHYRLGFHAMVERLEPWKVVCIGSPIEVMDDVPIIYFDGYSQQLNKRLKDGKQRLETSR